MGKSSKRKGSEYERRVVRDHEDEGIVARKIPLSGAMEGYKGDITVADHFQGEVKARKGGQGFKTIKKWLGDNDMLFLQEIAKQGGPKSPKPLVVLPWQVYLELMHAWGEQDDQP